MTWFVMFVMLSVVGCEHRWVKQGEWSRGEIDAWREQADVAESADAEVLASVEESPPTPEPVARGVPETSGEVSRVDLNTATEAQLMTLPGVGPAMANRIITHRTQKPFKSIKDLRKIKGIGAKTYKKLAPLVSIE